VATQYTIHSQNFFDNNGSGPGLEALLASTAKRGADEMADRYLIENREAAVGVQMFHMRQR
jgi:hypothetical protein